MSSLTPIPFIGTEHEEEQQFYDKMAKN